MSLDVSVIDEILKEKGTGAEQAIPILQGIQARFRYLPIEALEYVCAHTEITPSQLFGVATFYSQFRLKPVGETIIKVCHGTACHVGGADTLTETLENQLGIPDKHTTPDMRYTLESVACVGCCSLAPVVVLGNDTLGKVTPRKISDSLAAHMAADRGDQA